MDTAEGTIISVNGPIIKASGMSGISMMDIVEVGADRIIGEVIRLEHDIAVIQVYEDNTGLRPGDSVFSEMRPMSVLLGPGLITSIYDGIQRPLVRIADAFGTYFKRGIKTPPLETTKMWEFSPLLKPGDAVCDGIKIGTVQETELIMHYILAPPGLSGTIEWIAEQGSYSLENTVYTVRTASGSIEKTMAQYWPVRKSRPYREKLKSTVPLITGQRIIDTFFPIARGGTAAIPGGFGTGKTMTQHALAKWCNADIIIYIGCGERGNEMTEVLNDFPELIDPKTGRPLLERTVMIANTSNMPVPAREVSIYTGVTIAEYYRDMGYSVAVMADSASRWAEALRELSSRLGDMPAEEGFPPYLATRLAEFYERAGQVVTLSGDEGNVSIIGAVSPPGGDFSEPVTQHTTRFIRCFWALDKTLADARHYPSIGWIESYSEYLGDIENWWNGKNEEWSEMRKELMNVLLEDNRLQQIVKLVGPDALPAGQRFTLFCAEMIRNAFLQQNAFDTNDMYCSPGKQISLLRIIRIFMHQGRELLNLGADLSIITSMEEASEILRLKSEYSNEDTAGLSRYAEELTSAMVKIRGSLEMH